MIIDTLRARQKFSKLAVLDEPVFPLDRAALSIALGEYPQLDLEDYLGRLDRLATRAQTLLGSDRSPMNVFEALNEVLFIREGLRGNTEDYYDPRNSFLNEVLDRKTGIPISLSVIYMEVARRIGFSIQGVGFPGHFIVKHVGEDREVFLDPFNMGQIVTTKDCQKLLDKVYGGKVSLQPGFLRAMDKKSIVCRMLYNLKGIFYQKEEYHKALSVVEGILLMNPGTPSEIRDRGLLYMQTNLFAKALSDLEHYLVETCSPEDRSNIEGHVKTLRRIVTPNN